MKASSVFWLAIGFQCAGAVALNVVYATGTFKEYSQFERDRVFTAPTARAPQVETAPLTINSPPTVNPPVNLPPQEARDLSVTPLMEHAGNGNCEEVQRLIREGAKVNAVNTSGTDALIYAASAGHLECVELLLRAKARTDTVDKDGDSALSAARQQGHVKIVEAIEKATR
jgi:ankyrin repeat protein